MHSRRTGFTLVELLVVIAIIGILVGITVPAVQMAREAARRTTCTNNIRQIGFAITQFHDAEKALPAGWSIDVPGTAGNPTDIGAGGWGWASHILPYMEQTSLNKAIDYRQDIDDQIVAQALIKFLRCPSDPYWESRFDMVRGPDPDPYDHGNLPIKVGASNYMAVLSFKDRPVGDPYASARNPQTLEILGSIDRSDSVEVRQTSTGTTFQIQYSVHSGAAYAPQGAPFLPQDGCFPVAFGYKKTSSIRFEDIRDGGSNTILIGERMSKYVYRDPLENNIKKTEPVNGTWVGVVHGGIRPVWRTMAWTHERPNAEGTGLGFSSGHHNGSIFLFGDMSTYLISDQIDPYVFYHLGTRNGKEFIDDSKVK